MAASSVLAAKSRRAGEAEQVVVPERLGDGGVHLAELASVALVEDEDGVPVEHLARKVRVLEVARELLDGGHADAPVRRVRGEVNRILVSEYDRSRLGTLAAGGYIWHTTGSGKTLTSFKTAQLASKMEGVEKVLFVVDRKDLDYQTMKEYNRFEEGAADGKTSMAVSAPVARIIKIPYICMMETRKHLAAEKKRCNSHNCAQAVVCDTLPKRASKERLPYYLYDTYVVP